MSSASREIDIHDASLGIGKIRAVLLRLGLRISMRLLMASASDAATCLGYSSTQIAAIKSSESNKAELKSRSASGYTCGGTFPEIRGDPEGALAMPSKLVLCFVRFGVVWLVISIALLRNLGVGSATVKWSVLISACFVQEPSSGNACRSVPHHIAVWVMHMPVRDAEAWPCC